MATAKRIKRFLKAHPSGPLTVCVGAASPAGINWLAQQASDRPVHILFSSFEKREREKVPQHKKHALRKFVTRDDVVICHWKGHKPSRYGHPKAHLKAWVVCDERGVATDFLIGSANLTMRGLYSNIELMANVHDTDKDYVRGTIQKAVAAGSDAKKRVLKAI